MPIGLVALVVVSRVLNLPHAPRAAASTTGAPWRWPSGLVPLLVVAEQGRSGAGAPPRSLALYVIGALGVAAFVWIERRMGDDALLPLRLFSNPLFRLSTIITVVHRRRDVRRIALVPQYLQIVRARAPTRAGLEMLPLVARHDGRLDHLGQLTSRTGRYKIFPVVGLGLMVGMALFHFLLTPTPLCRWSS